MDGWWWSRRTGKREVALVILAFVFGLYALGVHALWTGEPDIARGTLGVADGLVVPAFAWAALAFGLDWVWKQGVK